MNYFRTGMLLAAMTALFGVIGFLIGGKGGMMIALLFAAGTNLFAYWNSDRLALNAHNAREVTETDAPEFVRMVKELALRAQMPMPRVYIMDEAQPNAFATGRNPENAAVAATTGLMQMLTKEELAGVMAHELAHIKHHDTLTMTITATLAGAISAIATWGSFFGGGSDEKRSMIVSILIAIVAPLAAMVIQMAISRSREYEADRVGGEICGNPAWLASALEKISQGVAHIPNESAEHHPATSHLFILNPLHVGGMQALFSTHPDPQERIGLLMDQARAKGQYYSTSGSDRAFGSGFDRVESYDDEDRYERRDSYERVTTTSSTQGPWGRRTTASHDDEPSSDRLGPWGRKR
jgi:heat shock protein HtpX